MSSPKPAPPAELGLKERILHGYCVRLHMTLIVSAVVVAGVLSSKLMLGLGVHSLRLRYPIAVGVSYAVFLLLVRVWIWYVTLRRPQWAAAKRGASSSSSTNLDFGNVNFGGVPVGRGRSGGGGAVSFGGGSSGGAGASDSWGEGDLPDSAVAPVSSGHGSLLGDLDFSGGDDDGVLVMVLLVCLILAIFCAGGYLVWAAPQILPEAAIHAVIAPALLRVSKDHHHGWMLGVLRSTVLPFAVVFLLSAALGYAAHHHCPSASRLMEVLTCPADAPVQPTGLP